MRETADLVGMADEAIYAFDANERRGAELSATYRGTTADAPIGRHSAFTALPSLPTNS